MTNRLVDAAMHAFPRRFRATRGVEMRDTLADVLDADSRRFVVVRAVVDIVVAGWALRLRTRPPLGRYLDFRLIETPLPVVDHPWLLDHVQGWFRYRQPLGKLGLAVALQAAYLTFEFVNTGEVGPTYVVRMLSLYLVMIVVVANIPYFERRDRDRIMRRHGYVPVEQPGS